METWSAHRLFQEASRQHGENTAEALRNYAQRLMLRGLPVIFTLGHLAKITGVTYRMLRETIDRKRETANYRMYTVAKRAGGRRFIHSVSGDLFKVQQFINQAILQSCAPHPRSFAFHRSGGVRACAAMHCLARWLFQYDLQDFFYDVTEIDVYRIFQAFGYRNLLAFEIGRLSTTTHLPKWQKRLLYHHAEYVPFPPVIEDKDGKARLAYPDRSGFVGVLPQGAPTSPMLSNLAARPLDEALSQFAFDHGLTYTRYADDITFSAMALPKRKTIGDIHRAIVTHIRKAKFKENSKKIRIAGPGSRKIVLGLLVDGEQPRLSRETYKRIDRHLHAAQKYDLTSTAAHEGFDSAFSFHNHLVGLVAFVKDVDRARWEEFQERLDAIDEPWGRTG